MLTKAITITAAAAISIMFAIGSAKAEMQGELFVNQVANKCLDVPGISNTVPGTPLQLYDCEHTGFDYSGKHSDQYWFVNDKGQIRNTLSAMCLDISGTEAGAQIIVMTCEDGNEAQTWNVREDGLIENEATGMCIGLMTSPAYNNETPLVHVACDTNNPQTNQRWKS